MARTPSRRRFAALVGVSLVGLGGCSDPGGGGEDDGGVYDLGAPGE